MKRSQFVEHVAWTGAGIAYTLASAGSLVGCAVADAPGAVDFVQISDSHVGFHLPANPDVLGTLKQAVDAINALPQAPAFVVHTGDITHLSTPKQFADAKDVLSALKVPLIALPGEHDVIGNDFKPYLANFRIPQAEPGGWATWENGGIRFIALLNVFNFEKMGLLGSDQLTWLQGVVSGLKPSQPIVVLTHVPLYALFPTWGWTTEDGAKALAMFSRFDNVTLLNGHIHQIITHTEGNLHFASADATAYPQPKPGAADKPGPVTLPHDDLLRAIGYRTVSADGNGARFEDHPLG